MKVTPCYTLSVSRTITSDRTRNMFSKRLQGPTLNLTLLPLQAAVTLAAIKLRNRKAKYMKQRRKLYEGRTNDFKFCTQFIVSLLSLQIFNLCLLKVLPTK